MIITKSKILFRVDANHKIGTGHLLECLWLARAAKFASVFCVNNDEIAVKLVKHFGFPVKTVSGNMAQEIAQVNSAIRKESPDVLVFDLVNLKPSYLAKIKAGDASTMVLNALKQPVKADVQATTVFSPHPSNRQYYGTKYILLKPVMQSFKARKPDREVKNILVLFGGGDAGNFTMKGLRALSVIPGRFRVMVITGGANKNTNKISEYLKTFPKSYTHYHNITDEEKLARLMQKADLTLASGGYTLSELMHLGIPTVGLAQNEIEQRHVFTNFPRGSFVNLGLGKKIGGQRLAAAVKKLITDYPRRLALGRRAAKVVDGRGISRLEKIITGLAGPKVLLLGASGNLGQLLRQKLTGEMRVRTFTGNILDRRNIQRQISKNDVIINLVGASTDKLNQLKTQFDLNVAAQALLLDVCKDKGVKRIIFPSTLNIYKPLGRANRESDPTQATNAYTLTKILAEHVYEYYSRCFGVPVTILRLGGIYGPGRTKGIFPVFIKTIKGAGSITIPEKSASRDFLYEDDFVDLIKKTIKYNDKTFAVFNGSTGRKVSFKKLAQMVKKVIPKIRIKYNRDVNLSTWGDPRLAMSVLGFKAQTSLEQGLKKTLIGHN